MDRMIRAPFVAEPPAALRGLTEGRALAAALLLYAVTAGYGVLTDGYHSDDWRHLAGTSPLWTAVEGRWLLEVIYRDLLGERFLLPVQLALAFPCFWLTARILARHAAAPGMRPAAALAVFAIGVNHLYMAEVLSFASAVFAYPFALLLSVGAFEAIARTGGRRTVVQALVVAGAAQLLAFSVAIYQTFAVAGLIVPVLVLIRTDRESFRTALRLAGLGALASALAIALYLVEWRLYAAAIGTAIEAQRFQAADAAGFADKLAGLAALIRSLHTGTLMILPFGLRAALGLFSLAGLGLLALAAIGQRGGAGARGLAIARMTIGAGLAFFVFPVLFWLFYEGDSVPPRAFGYIGFWTSSIFVAALTLASGALDRLAAALLRGGLAVLAVTGVVLALAASAFWSDSARAGARDIELARAIHARIAALPGYDGGAFRLVGSADHRDLSWGTLAGWSSFHAGNPTIGLFREMYGMADDTASLPVSPRACRGFPADGAAFLHEGTAYLCLQDFAPHADDLACAAIAALPGERFCLGARAFVHVGAACLPTGPADPALSALFHRTGRAYAPERSFSVASFAIPMPDGCHTVALAPSQQDLEAITLRLTAPDGAVLWEERIAPAALRARSAR